MADLTQAVAWHRQVAAMAAAADRAGVATAELPTIRARLLLQQTRLTEEAARIGAALPALMPTASEIAAVGPALGDLSESTIARTVRTMYATLDAADAALSVSTPAPASAGGANRGGLLPSVPHTSAAPEPTGSPGQPHASAWAAPDRSVVQQARDAADRSVALRNATIYGCYAATVLAVQIGLFVLLDESTLPLTGPLCLLVLPAFAWLAGFLTIGVAFRPTPGHPKVDRTPRLGAIVCAVPDLLLFASVVVLFAVNTFAR